MKSPSNTFNISKRLTVLPFNCMSSTCILPDRSTAIIISRPSVGTLTASPNHCGWLAAITTKAQISKNKNRGDFLVLAEKVWLEDS